MPCHVFNWLGNAQCISHFQVIRKQIFGAGRRHFGIMKDTEFAPASRNSFAPSNTKNNKFKLSAKMCYFKQEMQKNCILTLFSFLWNLNRVRIQFLSHFPFDKTQVDHFVGILTMTSDTIQQVRKSRPQISDGGILQQNYAGVPCVKRSRDFALRSLLAKMSIFVSSPCDFFVFLISHEYRF